MVMKSDSSRHNSTQLPLFHYNLCHPNHRVHLKDGIWSHPLARGWEMKVKYKPKWWFRLKNFIQQLHFNQLCGPLDFTACSLLTVVTFISPFGLFIEHFHFIQHHFWPEIVLKRGMPVQGYSLMSFLSYVERKRRYFEKCLFCSYNESQWVQLGFRQKQLKYSPKYSPEENKSKRFRSKWGWVNQFVIVFFFCFF